MTNKIDLPPLRGIEPRGYQVEAFEKCTKQIRNYDGPFFVEAANKIKLQ